jgi:hypothetical protein
MPGEKPAPSTPKSGADSRETEIPAATPNAEERKEIHPVSQNRRDRIALRRNPTARSTPISRVRSWTFPMTVTKTTSPAIARTIAVTPIPSFRNWSTASRRLSTTWRIAVTFAPGTAPEISATISSTGQSLQCAATSM